MKGLATIRMSRFRVGMQLQLFVHVRTAHSIIRVPTVIVAVHFAKVPTKRPKLCARAIRERDGNRCQYTGRLPGPDEGSLDHIVPRSRGGADAWENLVWSAKNVNQRKADRLPHEAGLELLAVPRAPRELPVTALLHNAHGVAERKLFVQESHTEWVFPRLPALRPQKE